MIERNQPYIEVWNGRVMIMRMFDGANVCRMEEATNWADLEEEASEAIKTMETPIGGVVYPCPPDLAEKALFLRDLDEWITLSEAHRIANVSRETMHQAIDQGLLTAKLDDRLIGGEEKPRVRRSRVLQLWPHQKAEIHRRPTKMAKPSMSESEEGALLNERFWEKVDVRGKRACWHWLGGRTGRGYGTFWADGMARAAHKMAYELSKGPVSKGKYVRRTCDNVLCVNPAHLALSNKKC
jgi:hypothetical protein